MLRAPALLAAEEAEKDETRRCEAQFLRRNLQGCAYASGMPYTFEMRQRLLRDYDNIADDVFENDTARYNAVAQRWGVSLNTVKKYVKERADLLGEVDGGWMVLRHVSKGARPQIQVCANSPSCRVARTRTSPAPRRAQGRGSRHVVQACALDALETFVHLYAGAAKTIAFFTSALNEWMETDFSEVRTMPCGVQSCNSEAAHGAQAAVKHAFDRLGLSRRKMNKIDPTKWKDENQIWRAHYLTEIRMMTDIFSVYFFDECHVENGRERYCWWYRGARGKHPKRGVRLTAPHAAGEKCYMTEKHRASSETMTINAIIGLHDFSMCARVSGGGSIARRAR